MSFDETGVRSLEICDWQLKTITLQFSEGDSLIGAKMKKQIKSVFWLDIATEQKWTTKKEVAMMKMTSLL